MVNLVKQKSKTIKLERNNKVIERSLEDYNANKAKYAFRGFKVVEDLIKDKDDKILEFEPKAKNEKAKKPSSRSKKKTKKDL